MSFSKCSGSTGRGSEGSGFTESKRFLNYSSKTKGETMTLFKSSWRTMMMLGVFVGLFVAGAAFAGPGDACDLVANSGADDGLISSDGTTCKDPTGFVAVTGITGIPSTGNVGNTTLSGVVAPDNATFSTIVWVVKSAGATGATVSGSTLTTTAAGTVVVTAKIVDGTSIGTDKEVDGSITISAGFVAVTNITGVPAIGVINTDLTLVGTVVPDNATNSSITWALAATGSTATGAAVTSGKATATAAGIVKVTATVTNGLTASSDFTKDFEITFAAYKAVTGITGVPTSGTVGTDLTLTGTVAPNDASYQTIVWSLGTGSTAAGATVTAGKASATGAGNVVVTATITNGATASTPYTQNFTIAFRTGPGPVTLPEITIKGANNTTDALNKGDGKTEIAAPIDQYVGNIKERLWVSANIDRATLPSGSTFTADTGFRYTWYRTTAGNEAAIKWGGDGQNTFIVKSTASAAQNGHYFQLPENLTAGESGANREWKYFVLVSAPSLGTVADKVEKVSAFATIVVHARPIIKINNQQ